MKPLLPACCTTPANSFHHGSTTQKTWMPCIVSQSRIIRKEDGWSGRINDTAQHRPPVRQGNYVLLCKWQWQILYNWLCRCDANNEAYPMSVRMGISIFGVDGRRTHISSAHCGGLRLRVGNASSGYCMKLRLAAAAEEHDRSTRQTHSGKVWEFQQIRADWEAQFMAVTTPFSDVHVHTPPTIHDSGQLCQRRGRPF